MRPAWRLATRNVFERRSRSALLVTTVALSAALIAAVSCAFASLNRTLEGHIAGTVGSADLRIKPAGTGKTFDSALLATVQAWPEVDLAAARLQAALPLRYTATVWVQEPGATKPIYQRRRQTFAARTVATGIAPEIESRLRSLRLIEGRWAQADDEIVLDEGAAKGLGPRTERGIDEKLFFIPGQGGTVRTQTEDPGPEADQPGPPSTTDSAEAARLNEASGIAVGKSVEVLRLLRRPVRLKVVGIVAQPPLGGRWQTYMTLPGLARLNDQPGRIDQVDILLRPGLDPDAVVARYAGSLPPDLIIQTTEKVTSGLRGNMKSNELGLVLAAVMAFLAATFIITTGMTTAVTEKQRELGMLRCIGATRWQLGRSQLLVGLIVGGLGGAIGTPLGVLFAFLMTRIFRDQVPTGLAISGLGLTLAPTGALVAGLVGGAVPAWQAARVSPLEALAARARVLRPAWVWRALGIGLACLAVHMCVVGLPRDGQTVFWGYATFGLPVMFLGYFVLGVPAVMLMTRLFGRAVSWLMRLPPALLVRTVRATPYRHGFTAGAMMAGLALMVALWTQGTSILRDWLGKLEFPDAFVTGLNLTPDSQRTLEALPFVTATCAVTLHPVLPDESLGVKALQRYATTFVAFEPEPFFRMTRLEWIQGEPGTALRRLQEGGAVVVAREFLTARGLGVGSTFRCSDRGRQFDFEIVGVVTSPGLELVSQFFSVGQDYTDQTLHAVFGSRRDLKEKFGSEAIHLIQIGLKQPGQPGAVTDEEAIRTIQRELFAAGILDAGSGRKIKHDIVVIVRNSLLVATSIAVFAMLVASLGVANLIIAGIGARQFEFGVLRSVGASRALVSRLVLGEAVIIALAACLLGTLMGFEGAYSGRRLQALLIGLNLTFKPPWAAIAAGWGVVLLMTLGAAAPAVWRLSRKNVRELVGAMKG